MLATDPMIDSDEAEYRQESRSLKFKNALMQGIGGAVVFGLFAAAGKFLLDGAMASTATGLMAALPWVGLAGILVLGVGCLYMGSKYFTASVSLDQQHQAKQISRYKGDRIIALSQEQQRGNSPLMSQNVAADTAPETAAQADAAPPRTDGRSWVEATAPMANSRATAADAANTSWSERSRANSDALGAARAS